MTKTRPVTLVGIGHDGCASLTSRAMNAISQAQVLVGGKRHLAFFPQFHGQKITLQTSITAAIHRLADLAQEQNVCVLASGDPLFFGIGSLVVKRLGAHNVDIIPQPSSMQLAFSRVGLPWHDAVFISLHGRGLHGLITRLRHKSKAAILTDEKNSPARIATHLLEYSQTHWKAWVCENLGGADERIRCFSVNELAHQRDIGPLNVLVLVRTTNGRIPAVIPFLSEEAFAKRTPKKGLITKQEVRLLSLAKMQLYRHSVVWDIGAGSGSVSIEAACLASHGHVYAIEADPVGVDICQDNKKTLGADNITIVKGRAPQALCDLEAPDAVVIGGSKGSLREIIDVCLAKLNPGGHLVINAVTLDNVADAYAAIRARGFVPDITLLQISRSVPLAHYLRYEALNPIHVFSVAKPAEEPS